MGATIVGSAYAQTTADTAASRVDTVAVSTGSTATLIPLAVGAVALLAIAGAGVWLWWRRGSAVGTRDYVAQPPVPEFATRKHAIVPQDPLRHDVEAVQRRLDELTTHVSDEPEQPVPRLDQIPPAPGDERSVSERSAIVFAEWCRRGGPMIGRVELFGAALAASVPEASVEPLFLDLNSQAEPPVFTAAGGASPAEYWMIRTPGGPLLLPHPQSAGQFRHVAGVFSGVALAPTEVQHVQPARVVESGGGFELSYPGVLR